MKLPKPLLLLHACCGPCSTQVITVLSKDYDVTVYFYDPNIHPKAEYDKRLEEAKKVSNNFGVKLIEGPYDDKNWFEKVKGLEHEPEGGAHCHICYDIRLRKSAEFAKDNDFSSFASTLTISPSKKAVIINQIGEKIAKEYGLEFLSENFKKKDGFLKSIQLSKKMGLYRQDYCGCVYSLRDRRRSMASPNEKKR